MSEIDKMLTIKQVAALLGVSETTVATRIKHGYIASVRMGGLIRIRESEAIRCQKINYFAMTGKEKGARIKEAIALAKCRGVRVGRPRRRVDAEEVATLRSSGMHWRAIAKRLGIGVGTAVRSLEIYNAQQPTERNKTCQRIPIEEAKSLLQQVRSYLKEAKSPLL